MSVLWGCYDGDYDGCGMGCYDVIMYECIMAVLRCDYDGCGMGCYDVIMYECIMDVSIMGRVRDHTTRQ